MSLASATQRNDYTADGATGTFTYGFHIVANTDLVVQVRNTSNVEATLTLTTDYTVTGVDVTAGGTIVLVESGQAWMDGSGNLTTNYRLTIRRVLALTQSTDIRNQGSFFPETHELVFDRIYKAIADMQEQLNRCIKVAPTIDTTEFDPVIPATVVATSALKAIQITATGDGVVIES